MSKEELVQEIDKLTKLLDAFEIQSCEVYSRVVGYYRPIKQWNKGKQAEWKVRAKFDRSLTAPE